MKNQLTIGGRKCREQVLPVEPSYEPWKQDDERAFAEAMQARIAAGMVTVVDPTGRVLISATETCRDV